MAPAARRHRAQRAAVRLSSRHDGSGSPQLSQIGGVMRWMAAQQAWQIGPASTSAIGSLHAAHRGARRTESSAFVAETRRDWGVGIAGIEIAVCRF
jgi:hypothetical protein